jgi:hypothetical protein
VAFSTQYHILNDSQEAGTAASSMVSDALLRVLEKARDQHEVAFLEKAVKEASATGCIGSCSAFIMYLFGVHLTLYVSSRFGNSLFEGIFVFVLS